MATRFGLLAEICLALLLLPILRGISVFRLLGIQFEASVRYHIWLGTSMIFFATLHGGGTLFVWGISHQIQTEVWRWQKDGRIYLAAEITLVTGLVIWFSSLPFVRRNKFAIFYYMHHLYVVFIAFFLFHTGDRHFYMVFPGVFLFGLDKLIRLIQSRPETQVLCARIFPCRIIELTLPKDPRLKYTPTSIIFIKIPSISKFHWHPFSITSSSSVDDQTMSVMIKCEGWWTNSVYELLHQEDELPSRAKCVAVAVEGPYGPPSFDFMRYDSLLLIAGGSGITPILSILQEIASVNGRFRNRFPSQIQLIYVTKKSQDISLLNSISHLILNQPSMMLNLKLRVFVTQEKKGSLNVRELLNEFSIERTILFDKNSSTSNHTPRPINPLWMVFIIGFTSVIFLISLCFFSHSLSSPEKKSSKQKQPSTIVDLFLLCSFLIAIACSALVIVVLRWTSSREEIALTCDTRERDMESCSMETITTLEEHEIDYGGRPNFPDLFSRLGSEFGGSSSVGVVVCGPESMKESVALAYQQKCKALKLNAKKQQQQPQPFFGFHSLNFTL